jgi:hypothetical protein
MRNFWVGLAGGLAILIGFAGTASALATISLIWAGPVDINIDPTGSIVLNVYLNTGPDVNTTRGGALTIDYSDAVGELTYVTSSTPGDFDFSLPGLTDTGTQVQAFSAVSFAFQPINTSVLMGTITFTVTPGAPGVFNITSLYTGGDLLEGFDNPAGFGSATITRTPEPGTLSLLVMGLGGLYAVGRRQRR